MASILRAQGSQKWSLGCLGSILSTLRPLKVDFGALEGSSWTVGGFKGGSKAKLRLFSLPIWLHVGSILESNSVYKSESKFGRLFDRGWDAFWDDVETFDPRNSSPRVHETLIFINSPFSPQVENM